MTRPSLSDPRALHSDLANYPAPVVVDAPPVDAPDAIAPARVSRWGIAGAVAFALVAAGAVYVGSPEAPVLVVCAVGVAAMVAIKEPEHE